MRSIVALGVAAALLLAPLTQGSGEESDWSAFTTNRVKGQSPPGWTVASKRLVPNMLDPREVVSLGTGSLPPGGGGKCGRYPAAALQALRRGDVLITVQLRRSADLSAWNARSRLLRARPMRRTDGPIPAAMGRIYTQELNLDRGGIWVYVAYGSTPLAAQQERVERILDSISLG